ncbi:MAG: hypothetical protein MUO33_07720 [Sedimentisphaerales bacterium]|nr:hypothetical protein [Sedimentisphaerales bacterium]
MVLEKKQVLITVKAYPNPSRKYGETVCCAGIDLGTGSWIRLYPIPFRDLEFPSRFSKYDVIEIKCEKHSRDSRIESYRVDQDSIRVLKHLDTRNNWRARKDIVLPASSSSFCEILRQVKKNKSLGMFKPCDIDFFWRKSSAVDKDKRKACYAQLSFFDRHKSVIENIPFDFYYSFKCLGSEDCAGHELSIVDWEMGEVYRRWRHEYTPQQVLFEKIRQKWLDEICSDRNDTYFYVGNMQRFREQFMVLGVFYPRK